MSQNLSGKRILLGLTGGIAAYKSAELCRELKKLGADVRVVMSKGAQEFITPLTMQALSGNPVHTNMLDPTAEAGMGHIELAKWPDIIVIAPATANFIARYAHGFADDLLTTLLLASTSPVALAPAMNQSMWLHPLTQSNISALKACLGEALTLLGPGIGEQACGDIGPGRMLESHELAASLVSKFVVQEQALLGKKVVITAGPTREAIDPVRYISNHSSGKMGYALAASCRRQGAEVVLISGPTVLDAPVDVCRKNVISAQDMHDAAMLEVDEGCDLFIACAAVADYKAASVERQKIKKEAQEAGMVVLSLQQNPDIVASVANRKDRPFTVGFAAETNDLLHYAESKLKKKNLDMIVANDVSKVDVGFNSDHNEVYVVTNGESVKIDRASKSSIAEKIVAEIIRNYN